MKYLMIILFASCILVNAQTKTVDKKENQASVTTDSLNVPENSITEMHLGEYKLKQPFSFEPDVKLQPSLNYEEMLFLASLQNSEQETNPKEDFIKFKQDLMKDLHKCYEIRLSSEPGIIGQILSAASLAAVGTMAYIHVKKYGFK